jgi:hypothetical protein
LDQDALLALWLNGVPLGVAWLVFADELNAIRYFELRRIGAHLELERILKADHLDQLRAGKHQAIAIQESSDAGLVLTRQYYFLRTAEVDWGNDKITSAGKTFHGVIVPWEREPPGEGQPPTPTRWIHPRELEVLLELELRPPCGPEPFPGEQWQWEELDETLWNELRPSSGRSEFTGQSEPELLLDKPQREAMPSQKRPGRPNVIPVVREVVRELIDRKKFVGLNGKEIEQLVRRKAKERFPALFPRPTQPSPMTISRALKEEGWPPSS